MYDNKPDQLFLHHVYASGVGGFIKRNDQILAIPSIGGGALSDAGGKAFTEVGPFYWAPPYEPKAPEGFSLSVDKITTKLWTEENDKEWISSAEVRVYGFNLAERVKIGLMVNQLTSRHPKGLHREELPDHGQPHISVDGSQFWNVYIDGQSVHITIDRDLTQCGTHEKLKSMVGDGNGTATESSTSNSAPDTRPDYIKDLWGKYKPAKFTRCSIVKEIRHPNAHGNSVDLTDKEHPDKAGQNLGRVFFGDLLVGDEMKHFNMLRWDLGCDTSGSGTGGSVNMNGATMP